MLRSPPPKPNSENKSESENKVESENKIRTRLQTKNLESSTPVPKQVIEEQRKIVSTPKQDTIIPRTEPNTLAVTTTQKTEKMNAIQIQQLISTSIPEFNGIDNGKRHDNMTRFTSTADSIYKSLLSEDERKIFNRLIRLRLTDEAFTRVNNRNPETYPQIKQILEESYSETYSLSELEQNYMSIQQAYGESIRNYGHRLQDALDKYKKGFKIKYGTQVIEPLYEKHLQSNTVTTFKRGLNNTILKGKIATSTTTDIHQIIKETETIEKMLLEANSEIPDTYTTTQHTHITTQPSYIPTHIPQQIPQVICNYCQEPNHTYDKCKTRILNEQNTKLPHYQLQQFDRPPLYCSHCKTTKGHTFAQCRNKYKPQNQPNHYNSNNYSPTGRYNQSQTNYSPTGRYNQNQNNYSRYQPPNNSPIHQNDNTSQATKENEKLPNKQLYSEEDLMNMLQNMKINRLYMENIQNQGNDQGSSQS